MRAPGLCAQGAEIREAPRAKYGLRLSVAMLLLACFSGVSASMPLRNRLRDTRFKIAYECYVKDNWEIFVLDTGATGAVNLTNTPRVHEHYPQVSPDGTRLCYLVDEGEGRDTVRSLWVMDIDGRNRKKLRDYAREPFWSPDGGRIGYLPQEYPKFNVMDFYTRGMCFYELASGNIEPHPNSANIRHIYNPCLAPNGKWIIATAHAGMGVDHGTVAIAANGDKVLNLHIPGCRAALSPDGRQIAWGAGDFEIAVAPIDLESGSPHVGPRRLRILDQHNRLIHVDWSPDGHFLCFSRGPAGQGEPARPGTFSGPCGLMGVYAAGWNLCAVSADQEGVLDLDQATDTDFCMLTTNGCSNKEPAWFRAESKPRREAPQQWKSLTGGEELLGLGPSAGW